MHTDQDHQHFAPWGSIAFFVLLSLLCAGIWFGVYFLMLHRA